PVIAERLLVEQLGRRVGVAAGHIEIACPGVGEAALLQRAEAVLGAVVRPSGQQVHSERAGSERPFAVFHQGTGSLCLDRTGQEAEPEQWREQPGHWRYRWMSPFPPMASMPSGRGIGLNSIGLRSRRRQSSRPSPGRSARMVPSAPPRRIAPSSTVTGAVTGQESATIGWAATLESPVIRYRVPRRDTAKTVSPLAAGA